MNKQQGDILDIILEKVGKIETVLTGNGEPSKGVIVRLDRLEVAHKLHKWVLGAMFAAVATTFAEFIFKLL